MRLFYIVWPSLQRPSSEKRVQSYTLFPKLPNIFEGIFEEKFFNAVYQNSTDDEIQKDIMSEGTEGVFEGVIETKIQRRQK